MYDDNSGNSQQYQGPGRLIGMFGTGSLYSLVGGLVGAASGALVGLFTGKVIKTTLVASYIGGYGSLVVGWFKGWSKGARGEAQFNEQQFQLRQANAQLLGKDQAIAEMKEELAGERKRFTETIQSRSAHQSHADAATGHPEHTNHADAAPGEHHSHAEALASRAEHGSHAAAHIADKATATHTEAPTL